MNTNNASHGDWEITTRINNAGNLAVEIALAGEPHAEVILKENGVVDLGTRARPWPMGEKGWKMPGAPTDELRKFRFAPVETQ